MIYSSVTPQAKKMLQLVHKKHPSHLSSQAARLPVADAARS